MMLTFHTGLVTLVSLNDLLPNSSTRKPSTTARTPSRTRYPTFKTTRRFNDYTTKSSFRRTSSTSTFKWWYGVVASAALITFAIVIAAVIWNRRHCVSNVPGQSGRGAMVLSAPVQVYGYPPVKTCIK
ncbi:uncharacterized protein LOC123544941 [Mercenaria mercenaria]|uniref:uncharacterized protein LOC123544941 n=1 Tax=Mercenaria mercenaria TaxID=6596 RepID=UPI00234F2A89|nr:uncharacterized protein LOC123544941 [Mercenaria mercenaria]